MTFRWHDGRGGRFRNEADDSGEETELDSYEEGAPLLDRRRSSAASRKLSAAAAAAAADPEFAEKKLKYPKCIAFIIGNEFCERFTYYGMRTILTIYLHKALGLTKDSATVVYHIYTFACYFFPFLGGIIADTWLGKYRTILYISLVYALGNCLMALGSATSIPNMPSKELTYLALSMIALGTGGIKPCVSSFGGDQFVLPQQERQLAAFFSVFYFAINAGSLLSTYITPELDRVPCLDQDTCYPLAFGVPALLMIVAIVIFAVGKSSYVIKKPQGNVLVLMVKCMWSAVRNKSRKGAVKQEHWLDHADEQYDANLRSNIRSTLSILLLFVPLPIFWALYDQQGSRWTFQATMMDGELTSSYAIKVEQMQVVNPLLILCFLPLCQGVLYPALNKCNLLTRPLQKMAVGGLLAALAFVVSGFLELELEKSYPVAASKGLAQVRVFNGLPCAVNLTGDEVIETKFILNSLEMWTNTDIKTEGTKTITLNVAGECANGPITLTAYENNATSFHLYEEKGKAMTLGAYQGDEIQKGEDPYLRIMYHFTDTKEHEVVVKRDDTDDEYKTILKGNNVTKPEWKLKQASYSISVDNSVQTVRLGTGGAYTLLIDDKRLNVLTVVLPNTVHILWLVPQYVIITFAEVMFSVTGLEFSFTQAPESMKSVLSSAWLLTVSFGNLIVAAIAEGQFLPSQAYEYFMFAGLMVIDIGLFILLAIKYKYVEHNETEAVETEADVNTSEKNSNKNGK